MKIVDARRLQLKFDNNNNGTSLHTIIYYLKRMDFGAPLAGNAGAQAQAGAHVDLMSWYMEIPVVSRLYLTGAFLTTAMCAVDLISPFSLYFSWELVFGHGQVWRLVTSYLFFGVFSVDFLFHMYFLVSHLFVVFILFIVLLSVQRIGRSIRTI